MTSAPLKRALALGGPALAFMGLVTAAVAASPDSTGRFLAQLGLFVGAATTAAIRLIHELRAVVTEAVSQRLDVIHEAVNGNAHRVAAELTAARAEIVRLGLRLDDTHATIAQLEQRLAREDLGGGS